MAEADSDSPPQYHALKEESKTEKNHCPATEVTIPSPHDVPDVYGVLFENKDNRIGFIQKVLLIKLFQIFAVTIPLLIFTAAPHGIYMTMEYSPYGRTNLIVVSSLLLLGVLVLIHYCDKARFTRPYNYMFLLAYPLSVGFFVGVVVWRCGLEEIFMAWILFAIAVFGLLVYSILALQSKIEFKTNIGIFVAAFIFIVSYALTMPFTLYIYYVNAFGVLYCSLALFALSAYMLFDIQFMMSKTYRLHLSPSDVVKAALIMHIDYRYMIIKAFKKNCVSAVSDE